MIKSFQQKSSPQNDSIWPWLHFASVVPVFAIPALFTAVNSELGRYISPGESPWFAWVRVNIDLCLGALLLGRAIIGCAQMRCLRHSTYRLTRILRATVWIEMLSIAVLALTGIYRGAELFSRFHTFYLALILLQGVLSLGQSGFFQPLQRYAPRPEPQRPAWAFFAWLFFLGAVIAFVEPSWRRLSDQVALDSNFEYVLRVAVPAWISGAVNLWMGIGLVGFLYIYFRLAHKCISSRIGEGGTLFLAFVFIIALFSTILLVALFHAISWEIATLDLKAIGLQLFLVLSVGGGAVLSIVYLRLAQRFPQIREADMGTVVPLTLGAALVLPLTLLWTSKRLMRSNLRLLAFVIFAACTLAGGLVMYGSLFNPWFTVFSYLKGASLKLLCLIAAGTAVLLSNSRSWGTPRLAWSGTRKMTLLVVAVLIGLTPFWVLTKYPEVKATVLQFNELTRVDAAFARQIINGSGLGNRFRLGQNPEPNGLPDPWPLPWKLNKTHASRLPENFNLLVVVVDAMRGDALPSAGYHRNTTPFLDRWAREECISFRRAYSQGGGSFAAFPFLVGGRSPFALYSAGLYQRNLYYKLAKAEKISHFWITGRFGPRAIFPPDLPVKTLNVGRLVSDHRTPTADEAFGAARAAIRAMPAEDRFLCFLHLMDVHNDLWKKTGGVDFGDRPRDIYDNNLSYLDRAFERFVHWLKEEGIYSRTVILVTADHGEQFWEHGASLHGHTVYEEEIRVPVMLVTHNMVKRVEDVPVISADMAPTIVDLAGYSVDPPYDDDHMGVSLRPLILENETHRFLKRDVAGRASFKRRYFLYQDWEWKLVFLAELDLLQLFNVVRDPMERSNLLQEEPAVAAELENKLLEYLEKVEGKTYLPLMGSAER